MLLTYLRKVPLGIDSLYSNCVRIIWLIATPHFFLFDSIVLRLRSYYFLPGLENSTDPISIKTNLNFPSWISMPLTTPAHCKSPVLRPYRLWEQIQQGNELPVSGCVSTHRRYFNDWGLDASSATFGACVTQKFIAIFVVRFRRQAVFDRGQLLIPANFTRLVEGLNFYHVQCFWEIGILLGGETFEDLTNNFPFESRRYSRQTGLNELVFPYLTWHVHETA